MNEIGKTKNFYVFMRLVGFLIILLPIGIVNLVFGYVLGDSPCTLCRRQREATVFIGVIVLFIVCYGMKGRHLAALLIIATIGFYQSSTHYGSHVHRDLDQGLGLVVFDIHTYLWAKVVF